MTKIGDLLRGTQGAVARRYPIRSGPSLYPQVHWADTTRVELHENISAIGIVAKILASQPADSELAKELESALGRLGPSRDCYS